ncbi:MAG: DUF4160 domain-containing protein [Acidobacteriota bacterium]|nr:DUF4160 domain-containing protein [Acidobacteriota bacterium]
MGTKTFDGVWFSAYSHDHDPPHVHGCYGEVRVIVDLLSDGNVRESSRWDAVKPSNGKRSDVRHVLDTAAKYSAELKRLWEKTHGTAS